MTNLLLGRIVVRTRDTWTEVTLQIWHTAECTTGSGQSMEVSQGLKYTAY